MIRNGVFANYQGILFSFIYIDSKVCKLVSKEGEPVERMFNQSNTNVNVYTKIVDLTELDGIYKIKTKGKIRGVDVDVENNFNGKLILSSDKNEVRDILGMEVRGKGDFVLEINANEVEVIWEEETLISIKYFRDSFQ